MGRWGIVALATAMAMLTACSPSVAGDVTGDETTTSTTRTPRITDDSGRPPVTFDPCHDIPDDVMNAAGYDAAKKEVADMPMGTYTFLGCTYKKEDLVPGVRRGYSLNILSGNVSLDEELKKNGHVAAPATINGRPALLELDPNNRDACTYVLQTDFGVVFVTRLYNTDHPGPAPQGEWCAGMEEFVGSIEPYIAN
ncbi:MULTISPECIES: DUF3558 domain-containing protein [unclassified Rhodococcus (in: high G+C Gram-positive bacteria)]|uniref:DUF3558 domain-containing protein n=1 Tax=unclassified Rhodococcus (in: high G+C Gram-positive bacteria) TaxID=192944 RepID=UPI000903D898|nr:MULTISPECIES: DUF3558 domain-containing protein [unclassified Rhodococcus (in: high G+C Gram-positive bacteria)]APE08420.1 hypothetical protein BO226_03610 [Rhodococcus sp. 2G]QXU55010.1 DUF3558 domain-containing protein [Rhodococcus sp. LW-XY12]